jgi:hypothetical protein
VDVFLPGSGGAQVHDLNPTQFPPVGLFWTVLIPVNGVEVDLANGTASMKATKVPIFDYGTLQNALFTGSNPPAIPGWISFKVIWTGGVVSMPVSSHEPTKGIFSGTFAQCSAQMEWEAEVGDFTFNSDPLRTSHSTFAEIGQETNGSYLAG